MILVIQRVHYTTTYTKRKVHFLILFRLPFILYSFKMLQFQADDQTSFTAGHVTQIFLKQPFLLCIPPQNLLFCLTDSTSSPLCYADFSKTVISVMHSASKPPVLLNCQATGMSLCNINPRLVKRKLPYPAGTGAIFYLLSKL